LDTLQRPTPAPPHITAMTVSGKATLLLIGGAVGTSYVGIGLAALFGTLSEWCCAREIEAQAEDAKAARRREKRDKAQTKKEDQEKQDAEMDYGDDNGIDLPSWTIHTAGTPVRVVGGENKGKEGPLGDDPFCKRSGRYLVIVDGEEWYIPRADVLSAKDPEPGARVAVLGGKNAGRYGTCGPKHATHDLQHVVLEANDANPLKEFVVEREDEKWPIAFGEDDKARTIVEASKGAQKCGLKPGMVVVKVNGDEEWCGLDSIDGDKLVLLKQDGWWLDRDMFDCFSA